MQRLQEPQAQQKNPSAPRHQEVSFHDVTGKELQIHPSKRHWNTLLLALAREPRITVRTQPSLPVHLFQTSKFLKQAEEMLTRSCEVSVYGKVRCGSQLETAETSIPLRYSLKSN